MLPGYCRLQLSAAFSSTASPPPPPPPPPSGSAAALQEGGRCSSGHAAYSYLRPLNVKRHGLRSPSVPPLLCPQVPLPRRKKGEVLVRLASAGINPVDFKVRAGGPSSCREGLTTGGGLLIMARGFRGPQGTLGPPPCHLRPAPLSLAVRTHGPPPRPPCLSAPVNTDRLEQNQAHNSWRVTPLTPPLSDPQWHRPALFPAPDGRARPGPRALHPRQRFRRRVLRGGRGGGIPNILGRVLI